MQPATVRGVIVIVGQHKIASWNWRVLGVLAVVVLAGAIFLRELVLRPEAGVERAVHSGFAGFDQLPPAADRSRTDATRFPVHINRPDAPPALGTDQVDVRGTTVTINCSTCHTIREPNPENGATEDLDEFHQGLTVKHGTLRCLSCHNPGDYDTLRLADGSPLRFEQVMTLCGQCHGPQWRDFQHGAHGGMSGYWDMTRGPRYRNNCIDCHDPHAPAFPMMQPTFKPIDRFLEPED